MAADDYNRRHYAANRERLKANRRAYGNANPEKIKASNKQRYATAEAKVKTAEATKQWALANPERYAEIRNLAAIKFRLKRLGLTIEQYEAMLMEQGFACAVCGSESSGYKRNGRQGAKRRLEQGWPSTAQEGDFTWSVDHCHQTGKVRGVLCARCNSALGMVGDNISVLEGLIDYLKKHR
jgi:hypothetical protein